MTDVTGNPEEERHAEFFYQPFMQEAVCRYFYGKVGQRSLMVQFSKFLPNCLFIVMQFLVDALYNWM